MAARGARPRPHGRHVLSPRLAAEFVQRLDIGPDEVVLEIGAGSGRLTEELCPRARLVFATELDRVLARHLLAIGRPNLYVHRGDALSVVEPHAPYRVVGNAPFGIGTGLLRRFLDDDRVTALDLILQREAVRKRAEGRGNVLAVRWGVVWRIDVAWTLPRRAFHPAPAVDAAWLRARRRDRPLLRDAELAGFDRFLRDAFARGLSVRGRGAASPRILGEVGIPSGAGAADLDVEDWVRLYRRVRRA